MIIAREEPAPPGAPGFELFEWDGLLDPRPGLLVTVASSTPTHAHRGCGLVRTERQSRCR